MSGAIGSSKVKQGLGSLNLYSRFAQLAVGGMGKQNGFGMESRSLKVARKENFSCFDGLLVPQDGAFAVVFERNEPEVAHKRLPGPLLTVEVEMHLVVCMEESVCLKRFKSLPNSLKSRFFLRRRPLEHVQK